MCILSAETFKKLLVVIKNLSGKYIFFIVIITALSYNLIRWNYLFLQPSTFSQAQSWINTYIPPEKILFTTVGKFVPFTPGKKVIKIQQQKNPRFFAEVEKILPDDHYPPNVRNIIYLGELTDPNNPKELKKFFESTELQCDFVLDIYFNPETAPMKNASSKNYQKLISFSPFRDKSLKTPIGNILGTVNQPSMPFLLYYSERTGLYIDIYKCASN